jgi:cyd operon protein YbgT
MWYFAWILGVLLACSFGIINGLWFEQTETNEKEKQAEKEKQSES